MYIIPFLISLIKLGILPTYFVLSGPNFIYF